MKYSVVIPAYNEAEFIGETVKSLDNQLVGRENIEIIVADNNSTDDTAITAEKSGADRVVTEKKQGTNFAREAGYKQATGDIVAFLDADSEPRNDWLEKIGELLDIPGVAAVSGPFDYGFTGIKQATANFYSYRILPVIPRFLHLVFRRKAGVLIGGNFAVRRGTMEAIGGFPPLAFWGDDAAIAMLVARKLGKVLFTPDIVIKSSPRRLKKEGFLRLALKYMAAYFREYFR